MYWYHTRFYSASHCFLVPVSIQSPHSLTPLRSTPTPDSLISVFSLGPVNSVLVFDFSTSVPPRSICLIRIILIADDCHRPSCDENEMVLDIWTHDYDHDIAVRASAGSISTLRSMSVCGLQACSALTNAIQYQLVTCSSRSNACPNLALLIPRPAVSPRQRMTATSRGLERVAPPRLLAQIKSKPGSGSTILFAAPLRDYTSILDPSHI